MRGSERWNDPGTESSIEDLAIIIDGSGILVGKATGLGALFVENGEQHIRLCDILQASKHPGTIIRALKTYPSLSVASVYFNLKEVGIR